MKKTLRIIFIILLVCTLGLTGYLGYRFFSLNNTNNQVSNEIKSVNEEINNITKEIEDLNIEIKTLGEENINAFTEYNNWIRQNKKLEEILK